MNALYEVFASMQLVDAITGPLKGIYKQLTTTEAGVSRLSQSMGTLTRIMTPLAVGAAVVAGVLALPITAAANFEQAMSAVQAVSSASADEMKSLERNALDMGAATSFSALQAASAQENLAKAGLTVNQIIAAMPGTLSMAAAGGIELAYAAEVATDTMKTFHMEASQVGYIGDVMAKTANTASTEISLLAQTFKNSATTAAAANVSLAELSAMAGKLSDMGIKGGEAGTQLNTMLLRMQAPTDEAAKSLQSLGISIADTAGNMRPVFDILEDLETKLAGMGGVKRAAILKQIFGDDAIKAVNALLATGSAALRTYAAGLDPTGAGGSSAQVAAARLNNFRGALEELSGSWETLNIVVGKIFLPLLTKVAQGVTTVINWITRLADTTAGRTIIAVTAALAAGVLVLTAFAAASWGVAAALPFVTASLAPVAGAIAAISWPVWGAIAAIGALWLAFKTNFGGIRDFVAGVWTKLTLVVGGVQAVLGSLKDGVGEIKGQLATDIQAAGLLGLVTTVARTIYRVQQLFAGLAQGFGEAWSGISSIVAPSVRSLSAAFAPLAHYIGKAVEMLFGAAGATDVSGWRMLGQVVGILAGSAFRALAFGISVATIPLQLLSVTIRAVTAMLNSTNLFEAGVKLVRTFIDGLKSMGANLYNAFREMLGPLGRLLPSSDAQEGPLSALTASGHALANTFGMGIMAGAPALARTTASAMAGVAAATSIALAPISPAVAAPAGPDTSAAMQNRAATTQSGKTIVIHSLSVSMPDVTDADGFVRALQQFVEVHDVG